MCWTFFCRELSKDTNILLQFKNKELETSYEKQRESMSSVPLIASVLIHVVASFYSSLILPSSIVHFLVVIAPIILTLPTVWISAAESFPMVCAPYVCVSHTCVLKNRSSDTMFNAIKRLIWDIIFWQSIIWWLRPQHLSGALNSTEQLIDFKTHYCP